VPSILWRIQYASLGKIGFRRFFEYIILAFAIGLVFAAFSYFIVNSEWDFVDWTSFYHRAASSIKNPYDVRPKFAIANPPWLFWILYPFSFLPSRIALAAWLIVTILVSIWCINRLGGNLYIVFLTLCSPAFVRLFAQGQIDVVVLLGFTLIFTVDRTFWKCIGYILMVIKPNVMGIGAVISWLKLRSREKTIVLATVLGAVLLSFLIHGFWPRKVYENITALIIPASWGIRIWPYGIPIGLILLGWSINNMDERIGALSTFFLVPYVDVHSLFPYTAVLFTTIPKLWATAVFILLWALALIFR
jgi:hypothetical protein